MRSIPFSLVAITIAASGLFAGTLASQASRVAMDLQMERLGARCDAGIVKACEHLVFVTGGQCAGPAWSGCRYGLEQKRMD